MLVCALCVVPVMFAAKASNFWLATGLIGLAAAAHQGLAANLFTLVSDLFPNQMVVPVVGMGTMCGTLAAIAFSQLTGWILQASRSYWWLFLIASTAYLVALVITHALIPYMKPAVIRRA